MHRLGDVVDVRLVEAAPVAGALRFELLSEGQLAPRGRKRPGAGDAMRAQAGQWAKAHPGRSPRRKDRKPGKAKSSKSKGGK
jgi:ribonuclease R